MPYIIRETNTELWRAIGEYHGFDNLDSYPLTFTDRAEVETRYEGREVK